MVPAHHGGTMRHLALALLLAACGPGKPSDEQLARHDQLSRAISTEVHDHEADVEGAGSMDEVDGMEDDHNAAMQDLKDDMMDNMSDMGGCDMDEMMEMDGTMMDGMMMDGMMSGSDMMGAMSDHIDEHMSDHDSHEDLADCMSSEEDHATWMDDMIEAMAGMMESCGGSGS